MDQKVGIACGCRKLNYGSILQSYALCESIKQIGYSCEFIWIKGNLFKHYNIRLGKIAGVFWNGFKHPSIIPKVIRSIRRVSSKRSSYSISSENKDLFEEFNREYIYVNHFSWKELKDAEKYYRKFVCGSDQIWNSYEYYLDPMYFLRFTSPTKRVAYAPSFGTNTVSYYNKKVLKKYISEFSHLSVREESGKEICRKLTSKEVPVVADPTFLMNKDMWINKFNLNTTQEEFCLCYFLSYPVNDAVNLIKEVSNHCSIKAIPVEFDCYNENEIVVNNDENNN